MENDRIVFTNMQGAHGPAIAEHVFAMLLSLTRQLPRHREAQAEGRWSRDRDGMSALAGRTLLVVGLGGIGTEVARRADAFDMRVLATARSAREAPAFVDHLGVADELDALLPEADVVVLCLPLTDATRGLFDAQRIARMKAGAYLLNIARGPIVDTDALIAALRDGRLAGAGLDVTDPEPLPDGHPLFALENVVITPHVAGAGEITAERRSAVFRENLRRFGAGEPLINVVDKEAGY
jgi:phosphoglycerate dehydrogenase-like enzyme